MGWKKFLKIFSFSLFIALLFSYWIVVHLLRTEEISTIQTITTFIIAFILLFSLISLFEKAGQDYKKVDVKWPFNMWTATSDIWFWWPLFYHYNSWLGEKILSEYDVPKNERLKIRLISHITLLFIILSGAIIPMLGFFFVLFQFRVLAIAVVLGILGIPVFYSFYCLFMLRKFYLRVFAKFISRYPKKA